MAIGHSSIKLSEVSPSTETIEKDVSSENAGKSRAKHGLRVWQTSLFIVGEVAGTGVLALPNAILGTGWIGIVMLIYFAVMAGFSGVLLGRCWVILEERYEKYLHEVQSPYKIIAYEAYGSKMSELVSATLIITMFGGTVVCTLLISGMLQELFHTYWNISICFWAIIVAGFLVPVLWLGSPKDFWGLALGATLSVLIAAILLIIQSFRDVGIHGTVYYPSPQFKGFSLAFGAILFGYGGASAFPTIQNDMRDRSKFSIAAVAGFIGIILIYAPVATTGYYVYGNFLQPNLATTVREGPFRIAAQILLITHLFCAITVVINPVFQEFESRFKIPSGFGWKRCVLRTLTMVCVVFICETVPQFGKILDLIGGSTNTLLTFIYPSVFYMKLTSMRDPAWKIIKIPLHERVFMWEIIIVGICGGIASTVSAVWEIASPDALSLPCFISLN